MSDKVKNQTNVHMKDNRDRMSTAKINKDPVNRCKIDFGTLGEQMKINGEAPTRSVATESCKIIYKIRLILKQHEQTRMELEVSCDASGKL